MSGLPGAESTQMPLLDLELRVEARLWKLEADERLSGMRLLSPLLFDVASEKSREKRIRLWSESYCERLDGKAASPVLCEKKSLVFSFKII